MNEEKKKKSNKIIGISIGILVVLLVVISSTYAYWQITRSQKDPNQIVAACLDFDVNFPVGITEENKWPMSGNEAMSTIDGYTFTVTNNCPEDVTYVIGLESVTSQGITEYLKDSSVGIGFDGVNKGTYNSLTNLEGPTANARGSKKLQTAIVKGKSDVEGENVNTHNLKLWIDENSDAEEQSKGFSAKLFITGGQKIENDMPNPITAEAFTFRNGEITDYDESYGKSVTIPATIDGEPVTTIDANAFKKVTVTGLIKYNVTFEGVSEVEAFDESLANIIYVLNNQNKGEAIDFPNLLNNIAYAVSLTDDADINTTLQGLSQTYNINVYTEETKPQNLEYRQFALYAKINSNMEIEELVGGKYADGEIRVVIDELDLSQAYNLELIEPMAFTNYDIGINDKEAFEEQMATKSPSLTKLIFGKTNQSLEIGWGAFNGIDVDNLIVYSNMFGSEKVNEEYINEGTIGFFAGANINNMQVKYVDGYPIIGDGALFSNMNVNQIDIEEGITELAFEAFENEWDSCVVQNINLPSTINKVGKWSLNNINNINFTAGHCNNVQIDSSAWYSHSVVTPSTCILGQNIN